MPKDAWAQQQLKQMGLVRELTRKTQTKLEGKFAGFGGSLEEETETVKDF
jgi:hypothetical protein